MVVLRPLPLESEPWDSLLQALKYSRQLPNPVNTQSV